MIRFYTKKINWLMWGLSLWATSAIQAQTPTTDLTARQPSAAPTGVTFEWHTSLPAAAANLVATPTAVLPGIYYGVYNAAACYSSPASVRVAANICPALTFDLSSVADSAAKPAGTLVSFHSGNPATAANKLTVSAASAVLAGVYYISYFDTTALCFSAASPVVVVPATCCKAGNMPPSITQTTINNVCPSLTANLATAPNTGSAPSGAYLVWSAHAAPLTPGDTLASLNVSVSGIYYALYFDPIQKCFGPADSVYVNILSCQTTPNAKTCDLTAVQPAAAAFPSGATIEWHSALPFSAANLITDISSVGPGLYYSIYNLGTCYSSPSPYKIITNNCPSATVNLLSSVDSTNKPAGAIVSFHTAQPVSASNRYFGDPTKVPMGLYYTAFYDTTKLCFSSSVPIKVIPTSCCNAGTVAPNFTAVSVSNVCPSATADLSSLTNTVAIPAGATLVWSLHNLPTTIGDTLTSLAVSAAGKYYAFFFDKVGGCYSPADSVTVTINSAPAAPTTSVTQPTCAIATGTIAVSLPASGVTYSFDNGATFSASATSGALSAGTYQVKVKDNISGCVSAAAPTVVNAQPATPAAPTTSVTQPTCAIATGTITVTAPASGATYSFDNGATFSASATSGALSAGTYQVKVKDNISGCVSSAAPTVVNAQPATPSAPSTSVTQPTCALATGTITVSLPASGVTYSFDNGASFSASATSGALAAGTYQVKVKDNISGCVSSAAPTVVNAQPATPAAPTTSVTQPTCAIATGTITVTAPASGATYSFDNGATFSASATSGALSAGTYQVKVKDNISGCVSSAAPTVVNAQPATPAAPTTSVTQPTCALATGTITVSTPASGVTYSFDNGASFSASATSGALSAGTYQVKVKDNTSGCVSSAAPTVVNAQPATPAAPSTSVTQPTCSVATGTITVSLPASGVTYSFDNGASFSASATSGALSAGTYQVKVKDNTSGCVSAAAPTVVNAQPATPAAPSTSVTQPTCSVATGTITVSLPASGVTYSFDNGASFSASATSGALSAGTYQVKVKDNTSGCVSAAAPTVVNAQPATPAAPSTSVTQPTCSVATGTITVSLPASGVTYSFDNGASFSASATSGALSAGTYQVKVKDNTSGCVSAAAPTVVNAQPATPAAPSTSVTQPTCSVATGTITVSLPASGVTYSFDNGATFSASATSGALSAGNYQVKVKDNISGCVSSAAPTVVNAQPATPAVPTTSVTQPTCAIATGTITVSLPASGVTYSFDNGATFSASATSGALSAGTYQVKVKDNISGCVSTASATTINAQPATPSAPTTSVTQPTCSVSTGTITVTAPASGVTYSFDNGGTFSASATSGALSAGTYQVKVKDNTSGCISAAAPTVVNAQPATPASPTASVTQPTCAVATGTITVSLPASGVTYSFDNGASFSSSATSGALSAGTYQVQVKDNTSGCISTATATVINTQPSGPSISAVAKSDPTQASCPGLNDGTIVVSASGLNLQYSKDNGATWQTSNTFSGLTSGSYAMKVGNSVSNCSVTYISNPVVLSAPTCPTCTTPSVGGATTTSTPSVCNVANNSSVTLSGQSGNVVKWQTSIDGGASWTDIANTTTTLNFTNASNGQKYRAVVNSGGICVDANSTPTTITTIAAACSTNCNVPKPSIMSH